VCEKCVRRGFCVSCEQSEGCGSYGDWQKCMLKSVWGSGLRA